MKKVVLLALCLCFIPLVSAGFLGDMSSKVGGFFEFGGLSFEDSVIIRIVLFVLVFILVFLSLKKIPFFSRSRATNIIVSLIVGLIAAKFISDSQLIMGILIPYGVLGTFLVTILPFLIFFFLLHLTKASQFVRKMAWIGFGLIYIVLFFFKYSDLEGIGLKIYLISFGLIVLAYAFDRPLHRFFTEFPKGS